MPHFTASWMSEMLDVTLPDALRDVACNGFCFDTRELQAGQCFVAIRGAAHDGHAHVRDALARGAALALVQQEVEDARVLQVDDTVSALQQLAVAHRERLCEGGCRVIAVLGSNGKTTTRHLMHHVLTEAGLRGTQSPKSFNNHLGVPITLLGADPSDAFVACEIGTNHPGEVAALAAIATPDMAVVTNIGEEHLEFFGDLAGVREEEFSVLPFVRGETLLPPHQHVPLHLVPEDCALIGEHLREAGALAATIALKLGVAPDAITKTLASVEPVPGRMELHRYAKGALIHDAYNANPSSMEAALRTLATWPARCERVAILGDMMELGEHTQAAHQRMGELAASLELDRVIAIGPHASTHLHPHAGPTSLAFATLDEARAALPDLLQHGDLVLLKASRGMAFEHLIPTIAECLA